MNIISKNPTLDSGKDSIVFIFANDDELNTFLSKLAKTEVKTSGIRVLTLIPENMALNSLQVSLVNILEGLDGIGCDNDKTHQDITDTAIKGIKDILKDSQ